MSDLYKIEIPKRLIETPEPPSNLYARGSNPSWDSKLICVVGSRRFTSYGKEACEKIISDLNGYDITIVSGLALGIDAIAHKAAIENNLKTIAVPGSGLNEDVLYPRTNRMLAEKIINSGGTLLSEFEPDFKATPWSFPKRNRIMAGISDVILVIEATEKSGTLITSRLGLEYNKEVGVVPASIFSGGSKGSNKLLKQGATPITSGDDILELLNLEMSKNPKQKQLEFENCSNEERKILECLKEPLTRDELVYETKIPINKLNTLLSIMEIKGLIKESFGKFRLN